MGTPRNSIVTDGVSCSRPGVGHDTGVIDTLGDWGGTSSELKDIHFKMKFAFNVQLCYCFLDFAIF